jgi:hypothetical protein
MKSSVWLSYDLGVQGDYESLYAWLDKHEAVECGDSLAYFNYTHNNDLVAALRLELPKVMKITPKARIYVIRQHQGTAKGKFVFGNRHSAPWAGSAGRPSAEDVG